MQKNAARFLPAATRAGRLVLMLALILGIVFQVPASVAQADVTFTVNTGLDTVDVNPGDGVCADVTSQCSLRAAVMEANAYAGLDTIILPTGTYTLTLSGTGEDASLTGDLDVLDHLIITGGGNPDGASAATIIEAGTTPANGIDRVISVNPGGAAAVNLTLQAVTIRHGSITGSGADGMGGGVLFNAAGSGVLTVYNSRVNLNTAASGGGAIAVLSNGSGGTLDIDYTEISGNTVSGGDGGGIHIGSNVLMDIRISAVDSNTASGNGGGIYQAQGTGIRETILEYVAITNNNATGAGASGGGAYLGGWAWPRSSTISGNDAAGYGGGLAFHNTSGENPHINLLTVANNRANSDGVGSETGGGVWVDNLSNPDNGRLLAYNSLIVGNFSGTGSTIDNLSGNLLAGSTPNLTTGDASHLAPLAVHPNTHTAHHRLLPGSPALDAGDSSHVTGTDQRSRTRVVDSNDEDRIAQVDLGAVEMRPTIDNVPDQTATPGILKDVSFRVSDITVSSYTVNAEFSNDTLFPDGSYSLSNVDDLYTLHMTPAAGQTGTATVTLTITGGSDYASDTFVVTVGTPPVQPDMTLAKSHTGNFTQGQTGATYTLVASNAGGSPTDGTTVTVVDTLPTGLTATAMTGSGWTCTLATFTCTRSNVLAATSSYPAITLTVDVSATAPTSVTNTATVAGGGETNTANNSASDPTTITQRPDLTIDKFHTGNFTQGQAGAAYSITVTNNGTGPTSGTVTVTDTLPTGLTAATMAGSGWSCTVATRTCSRSDALTVGNSYPTITLTVNVAADAPASVSNSVTVSGGNDSNPANNTDTDLTTISAGPDLQLTKTHTGNFTQGQTGATFTLTATNNGSSPTSGTVTVTDILPTGLTSGVMSGDGWTCGGLSCSRADVLPASTSYPPITLTVNVATNAPASVINNASVSGGGDTNASNNNASDTVTVLTLPDLRLTKTHTGNIFQNQTGVEYTLTVTNHGGTPTSGLVTVTDTLPTGLTSGVMAGTGWSCTGLSCTRSDALTAGASYPPITLTVSVSATAPASVTNTAAVSGGNDGVTGNNSASDPATVYTAPVITTQPAPVTICEGAQASFTAAAGQQSTLQWQSASSPTGTWTNMSGQTTSPLNLTTTGAMNGTYYRAVFTNPAGSTNSNAVLLTVNTPPVVTTQPQDRVANYGDTVTFNSAASGRPAPTVQWQTRTDPLDPWANITSATIATYTLEDLDPYVTPEHTYYRAVWSNTCGATVPSNSAHLEIGEFTDPDMTVTKTHPNPFYQNQIGAIYTINVRNSGGWVSAGTVTVTDNLPTGMTATAMGGTGWNCTVATRTCTRSDALAAGESYPPITLTVNVAADAPASLTNTVTVSGGNEINTTNNSGSDITPIQNSPSVTTHPVDVTVTEGETATFTAAGGPDTTVQWQSSPSATGPWTSITGATAETLSFTADLDMDGTYYRARFTNPGGTVYSDAALLTVESLLSYLYLPIVIRP